MSSHRYFTKLHTTIIDSSLWQEPYYVRLAFLTLCVLADSEGMVYSLTPAKLARRANITLEESRSAIAVLSAPDAESGRLEEEGRRILLGVSPDNVRFIKVVNKRHYEELGTRELVRESEAERKANQRARRSASELSTLTLISLDWRPSDELVSSICTIGRSPQWVLDCVEHFLAHHDAKQTQSPNWDGEFRKWCIRQKTFDSSKGSKGSKTHGEPDVIQRSPSGVRYA